MSGRRPDRFHIRFRHETEGLDQDEETFEFQDGEGTRRLRVHDYAEIFGVPGLYEALVYDRLECHSPERLSSLLQAVVGDWPEDPDDLRVLDLGAGNGIVAEALRHIGVGHVVGLDLLPEAAEAAERDRPQVYDDYVVADLTDLSDQDAERLAQARLDCLVTAAALGFGDIPPEAFATAYNLIAEEGWVAMTIKEDFLDPQGDDSGFARLLRWLIDTGAIEIQAHHRYCHRLSIDGEQLFYLAVVARKRRDIPMSDDGLELARARGTNGAARKHRTRPSSLLLSRSS